MEVIKIDCDETEKKDIIYTRSHGEEEGAETEIEIIINGIENIIRDSTFNIKVTIDHENMPLGESRPVKIYSSLENTCTVYPIDYMTFLPYSPNDTKSISDLVSAPILIKVFEIIETIETVSTKSLDSKKKDKSSASVASKRVSKTENKLIGTCNVDLIPIVLGESVFREKVVLEAESYSWDEEITPWENLPRLTVTLRLSDPENVVIDSDFNILYITVESIYNPPLIFNDDVEYKCATVLQKADDTGESPVIFEPGKWTDFHDVEKTKAWKSLQYLNNRARLSTYKISCDNDAVKNEFKCEFDFNEAVKQNKPRIEWNIVHRTLLLPKDIKNIQDKIKKYKYWPFEIMVTEKQAGDEHSKLSKQIGIDESNSAVYQCYVDVSKLLFPGRTQTRVLAQLYTQSSSEMEKKTGIDYKIFDMSNETAEELASARTSKTFRQDSLDISNLGSEESVESFPIVTECGKPVLILIEFQLYQPFIPARVLEDFTEAIDALKKKPKPKRPFYCYTPDLVHEQYINCIKQLVDVIGESYKDFVEHCECVEREKEAKLKAKSESTEDKGPCSKPPKSKSIDVSCPYSYIEDELSRFRQFLHESGKYVAIRSTLKNKIIDVLDQKFALNSSEWYSIENQNFVISCYKYLIEEMHVALNTKVDTHFEEKLVHDSYQNLWFRAEEAYELEEYDKADTLFTKIVSNDRQNPDYWIIYAMYHIKISNIDEATECCKIAIELDSRHKIALLFYGVILAIKENYDDAEIFLKGVTHFYPRFAEGWAVLHLLYIKIQYYPGIDLTLEIAEKCLKDRVRETESMDILKEEPMAWSTMLCRQNKIFLLVSTLLLKLNLYNFAALALAQELCHCGEKTVEALYFLAVNYYLQGNYDTALQYLNEADDIIGLKNEIDTSQEYSVAALMGHCYNKMEDYPKAIESYEAVDMMYDRPEDIHLVHLRMGFYYIDIEEYVRARNVFLRACKTSATCKTWLGVGMASYHLEKFDESEAALMEANRIDGEDPNVWAYLCLLSMSLHRYEEFSQCYRQMVKNNLRSDKLWRLITQSMDISGYKSPVDTFEDFTDKCTC